VVGRVREIRTALVEFMNDLSQVRFVVSGHEQSRVGLLILPPTDVELLDVEGTAEIHDEPERGLHRPGVDDVALEFDDA
jgi:hypothetical protein